MAGVGWRACSIGVADAAALQAFLERNPGYSRLVSGRDWLPDEARTELESLPPPDWPQGPTLGLAVLADDGAWLGFLVLTQDLLALGVWHIALFLIDEALWGSGLAGAVHTGLEQRARAAGARWLRLGVVQGNRRAERFWTRMGYRRLRLRTGVTMGLRVQDLQVMAKPLGEASLADYLALVARDRPDAA